MTVSVKRIPGAANRRKQGLDAGAGFHHDHHRKRRAPHVEAIDLLLHAVIVDTEVILLQVQHQLALGVPHHDGRVHQVHAYADGLVGRFLLLL